MSEGMRHFPGETDSFEGSLSPENVNERTKQVVEELKVSDYPEGLLRVSLQEGINPSLDIRADFDSRGKVLLIQRFLNEALAKVDLYLREDITIDTGDDDHQSHAWEVGQLSVYRKRFSPHPEGGVSGKRFS